MHDCNEIEQRIVDLVFGELAAEERLLLTAEVEDCAHCLGEYRNVSGALLLFDRAAEQAAPDELTLRAHHASLRARLMSEATLPHHKPLPLWRRLLTARLPVPAPAAALVLLALVASSALALRSSGREPLPEATPSASAAQSTPPAVIEVPVYHDRVVTKTVYVEKARGKNEVAGAQRAVRPGESRGERGPAGEGALFTRANLADYQPPDEMQIRVIKRSNSDEK